MYNPFGFRVNALIKQELFQNSALFFCRNFHILGNILMELIRYVLLLFTKYYPVLTLLYNFLLTVWIKLNILIIFVLTVFILTKIFMPLLDHLVFFFFSYTVSQTTIANMSFFFLIYTLYTLRGIWLIFLTGWIVTCNLLHWLKKLVLICNFI